MGKVIKVDGHDYFLREDGLYETKDDYVIADTLEWMADKSHFGYIVLCKTDSNGGLHPTLLSIDSPEHTAYKDYVLQGKATGLHRLMANAVPDNFIGGFEVEWK